MSNEQLAAIVAAIIIAGFASQRTNLLHRFFYIAKIVKKWLDGKGESDGDDFNIHVS